MQISNMGNYRDKLALPTCFALSQGERLFGLSHPSRAPGYVFYKVGAGLSHLDVVALGLMSCFIVGALHIVQFHPRDGFARRVVGVYRRERVDQGVHWVVERERRDGLAYW